MYMDLRGAVLKLLPRSQGRAAAVRRSAPHACSTRWRHTDAQSLRPGDPYVSGDCVDPGDGAAFARVVLARNACRSFDAARNSRLWSAADDAALRSSLALAARAPSSFNAQPVSMVCVREAAQRQALADAMVGRGNRRRVLTAAAGVVVACDNDVLRRVPALVEIERSAQRMPPAEVDALALKLAAVAGAGGLESLQLVKRVAMRGAAIASRTVGGSPLKLPSLSSLEAWGFKAAGISTQTLLLACTASGLSTCPMEGFEDAAVREVVDLPSRFSVACVVAVGHADPSRPTRRSPRFKPEHVVFDGKYGQALRGVPAV